MTLCVRHFHRHGLHRRSWFSGSVRRWHRRQMTCHPLCSAKVGIGLTSPNHAILLGIACLVVAFAGSLNHSVARTNIDHKPRIQNHWVSHTLSFTAPVLSDEAKHCCALLYTVIRSSKQNQPTISLKPWLVL